MVQGVADGKREPVKFSSLQVGAVSIFSAKAVITSVVGMSRIFRFHHPRARKRLYALWKLSMVSAWPSFLCAS
jgi:hypothetical protein